MDYGLGNILAFENIFKKLNIEAFIAKDSSELKKAERIILPGVGSFDWAMRKLNDSGMRETLDVLVLEKRKPVLGICVGMQIMANRSDEGSAEGLGWIEADVVKFDQYKGNLSLQLPHMGWNLVKPVLEDGLFGKNLDEQLFYFLHSFYFKSKSNTNNLAQSNYGGTFTSCTKKDNIYGVQFHPEKSHLRGIELLKNFATLDLC